jgi:multidrug efflux pump subunit AcrA (membrane-fusion protein)
VIGTGLVLGIVAIGHIPVSPPILPEGKLRVPDNSAHRQPVYAGEVGRVVKIYVESGDFVRAGQPLVELELTEIEQKIDNLTTEIKKQELALAEAQVRHQAVQVRIGELRIRRLNARNRADRTQSRAVDQQAPEIAIHAAEIQELRSKQASLRNQAQATQELLDHTLQELKNLSPLAQAGGISKQQTSNLEKELIRYKRELSSYTDQVQEINQKIQAARLKSIIARQALMDNSTNQTDDLQQIQVNLDATISESIAQQNAIDQSKKLINKYRQDLNRLMKNREKHRIIEAERDGRVDGSDLTSKVNAQVNGTEKLLEIVNLQTLQVPVEIDQFDRDVVRKGMQVKIRPLQPNQPEQTSKLETDESVVRQDATQQKQQLLYFATVDNRDGSLRPGEKVYVTVLTEPMPLYKVLGRELKKLFKPRQFGNF